MISKIKNKIRIKNLRKRAKRRFRENAALISKNTSNAVDDICPNAVNFNTSSFTVDDNYNYVIAISELPEYIANGFLNSLYKTNVDCDISIHIQPMPISRVLRKINRELNIIETQIYQRAKEGVREDVTLLERRRDLQQQQLALQHESSLKVSIYIKVKADSFKNLKKDVETIYIILKKGRIKYRNTSLLTKQAYQSVSPLNSDVLGSRFKNIIGSPGAAKIFPFIDRSFISFNGKPVLWGYDLSSGDMIYFDIFSSNFSNYNLHCASPSGSGKTFLFDMLAARYFAVGDKVTIISPVKDDYKRMCESYSGEYIRIGVGEEKKINICALPKYSKLPKGYTGEKILNEHIEKLINYIEILAKGLTVEEQGILNHKIKRAYFSLGINEDEKTHRRAEKEMPIFYDIYSKAIKNSKRLSNLKDRLRPFVEIGTKESMFNGHTNVNLDNDLTVFDLSALNQNDKSLGIHIINDLVWTKAFEERKRWHVFEDEMWSTLETEYSAKMSDRFARLARSLNISFATTSQNFRDYIENFYGRSILANAEVLILLRQEETEIPYIKEFKNINEKMTNFLLQADVGEGIMFLGRYAAAVKFEVSLNEKFLYETNPEKLREMGVIS